VLESHSGVEMGRQKLEETAPIAGQALTSSSRRYIWSHAMTYEYACEACGHQWEAEQSIKDAPLKKCAACGKQTAKRLVSGGTGFLLKGGGWYADGYGSKGGGSGSSSDAPASKSSSSADSASSSSSSPKTDAGANSSASSESAAPKAESTKPTSSPST
jgi:putative FmdB family regulatory protein